jgi:hypothetical protein
MSGTAGLAGSGAASVGAAIIPGIGVSKTTMTVGAAVTAKVGTSTAIVGIKMAGAFSSRESRVSSGMTLTVWAGGGVSVSAGIALAVDAGGL